MVLLDRLLSARDRVQSRARARQARRRRNISVEQIQRRARERRIERGTPENRREAAEAAAHHVRGLGEDVTSFVRSRREAAESTPSGERSNFRRAASVVVGGARRAASALELEAEDADRRGDSTGAVAARAQDVAMMGPAVMDASLDPSPDGTLEAMATGGFGLDSVDEPIEEDVESQGDDAATYWENLVMGTGPPNDRDEDGVEERHPLDFDDPVGVLGRE